jgi:hypothetical protein
MMDAIKQAIAPAKPLDAIELRRVLSYDPNTGIFLWKVALSNSTRVGEQAGSPGSTGHLSIWVHRRIFKAHRLAWLYVYGEWPKLDIDHINGVRLDNRISNLRDVPRVINVQNIRNARKDNSTGYLGVSPNGSGFRAEIGVNRKKVCLGTFKTPQEAHAAYLQAKQIHHPGAVNASQ